MLFQPITLTIWSLPANSLREMIISSMFCNFLSFTDLLYTYFQLLSGTKCFKQSIISKSFNSFQERRVFSCLAKNFPKVQRHFLPATSHVTPLNLPQETVSRGVPIPSLHSPCLGCMDTMSSAGHLFQDSHGLLLLHRICPQSVMSHIFWNLEIECQLFSAKGTPEAVVWFKHFHLLLLFCFEISKVMCNQRTNMITQRN